ncbi:MFS transporter [Streptomyces sp. NPDC051940]|uniref:MFS transporter n=1 Tax=Streptomyces sp. NPDC051940 TaxID=3155675 RepID=UPI003437EA88
MTDLTEIRRSSRTSTRALYLALAVDAVGTGLYLPLSMLYFLKTTDIPVATVGLVFSAGNIVSLPLPLLTGRLVDRFGAKPLVVAGQLIQAAGFALFLVVDNPYTLFAAAVVECTGLRVYWSSAYSLLAEQADREGGGQAKDLWFAREGMIRNAGVGAGAVLAGALIAVDSAGVYRLIVSVDAVSFLVAAAAVTAFVRRAPRRAPSAPGARPAVHPLRNRAFVLLTTVNCAFTLCHVFSGMIPVYATEGLGAPGWTPSLILTLNTVLIATLTAAVTRFARARASRPRAMVWAGRLWLGWALGMAGAVLLPGGFWLVAALAVITLCWTAAEMLHGPASNAIADEVAPKEARGAYLGVFQYSFVGAMIIAPGLFGVLFSLGRVLPWLAVGALAAGAALSVAPLARRLGLAV